jgi:hypothetical protein
VKTLEKRYIHIYAITLVLNVGISDRGKAELWGLNNREWSMRGRNKVN